MHWLVRNSALVLLLALLASRAESAGIRQTIPFRTPAGKATFIPDCRHAQEGTKESYTQGGYTKAIHQFASSPVVPYRVAVPSPPDTEPLYFGSLQSFLRSSFYYSSFCNKAPPLG